MTTIDPNARAETGRRIAAEIGIALSGEPETPVQAALRDFVCAEVWSRPGLDRRARYIISITGAANAAGSDHLLESFLRGALEQGALTLLELREIALHLTGYAGFSQALRLDAAISRVADAMGLPPARCRPLLKAELPADPNTC